MKDVMEKKIGQGLILAEGDRHRSKGVEMTKAMENDFETSRKNPKAIRIADLAQRTTTPSVIGLAGMGYDFSSIQNPTSRLITDHDPELWGPDAGIFNPERWMGPGNANSGGATSNYVFVTLFHGPRSCIGAAFGQAELACLVAVTVWRFEMELLDPGKELRIKHGPLGVPEDGVVVNSGSYGRDLLHVFQSSLDLYH
ncbi:cytochrome P450 4F5 [Blastomyces dermatitidis ATCC 18188]|uniref:Cytochrome P450 4F5 n=1 Tax=Ajellomyces dermatitidis (strain ATCC 18188 / CBS 674.68) TaxID=653446 RepID=F2T291_AJEDA|nr:cytochrome P450 4F5 [Blastomyces dermatitidis ATCC 18188]